MASLNGTVPACPLPMKATSNGVFQGDDPFDFALPLAIVQICLVLVVTRLLALVLRPLRQPRVIAEIVGGILLGPSALGRSTVYLHKVFPPRSLTVLDTLANIGLLFFLFLVGLELDMKALKRTGKKALSIALAGISLPFLMGIGASFVLRATISKNVAGPPFLVFMGVALSITAFPVLARILAELKLLTTDVGRMAMSAAAVNDVAAWILLALAIALSGTGRSPIVSLWVLLCGAAFIFACTQIFPRLFRWMAQRCPEGEPVKEIYVCATLASVLVASFFTDLIGIHALFGAFVVGVLVPKEGPFAGALVEKVEDLISGLFLPLYFVLSGLKTNVATIQGAQSWGHLVLVIVTACFGKIVGTLVVTLAYKVPLSEALALAFLMNTKGLVELIVLNIGKDLKVLNDQTFAIMVLMAIFTTFITTPLVMAVYKPARRKRGDDYKHRTIQRKDESSQLRILTCFHSLRNVPSMLNLIEASRGSDKREGLCVYAMHLMELSERPSAIRMVHKARKDGVPFWNKGQGSSENQVIVAFEAFRQLSQVTIRPMTAISAMSDIHEDICASAESKKAAIVILPYHKQQRIDGSFETTGNEIRLVNKKVLDVAPCSVGILVDRGLGGTYHIPASNLSSTITVLFFGGEDDLEALAYGRRMAEHPGISLVVVRIILASEPSQGDISAEIENNVSADSMVKYEEKCVESVDQAVEVIKEYGRSNLIVVGRKPEGQIADTLIAKAECPDLGPIGSLLSSPELSTTASVLVIQKYTGVSLAASKADALSDDA